MLKVFLAVFVSLVFLSGCTKTVYVDRPVEVLVPVKCEVPRVESNFEDTDTETETVTKMITYIYNLLESIKVCQPDEK